MTNELKPCPFCGGDIVHEFKTSESGEPYGDGLYVCQNVECGAAFKFPQDWSLSMSRKDESERRFNTRYKRTCHKVPGKMGYQGRKVICSECGYGLGYDRWSFCPKCGAEICGAEVVDGD